MDKKRVQANEAADMNINSVDKIFNGMLQSFDIIGNELSVLIRCIIFSNISDCLKEAKKIDSNAAYIDKKINELWSIFKDFDKTIKLFQSVKTNTAAKKQQTLNLATMNINTLKRNMLYILLMTNIGISHKNKVKIQKEIKDLFKNTKMSISHINDHIKIYNETSDIKLEFNVKWI